MIFSCLKWQWGKIGPHFIAFPSSSQGHIYVSKRDFHKGEKGWLAFANGLLFYKSREVGTNPGLKVVNAENLDEQQEFHLEGA